VHASPWHACPVSGILMHLHDLPDSQMLCTVCQAQDGGEQVHSQGLLTACATTRGSACLQPLYPLPKARRPDVPAGCTQQLGCWQKKVGLSGLVDRILPRGTRLTRN
jgi:hypothetical protein